jgi:hypothetical protein
MSQESVEIVRQGREAYTEQGIDGVLDYYAVGCVLEEFRKRPIAESMRGARACGWPKHFWDVVMQ